VDFSSIWALSLSLSHIIMMSEITMGSAIDAYSIDEETDNGRDVMPQYHSLLW
jgi:hypothetical protein